MWIMKGDKMSIYKSYPDVLYKETQLGPYPMERLQRVDKPTIEITENVQRFDDREHGFSKALRGDYGPMVQREFRRFVPKYPVSGAQIDMIAHLSTRKESEAAAHKAPLPDDPQILSRHVKSAGYFFGADVMGICELPQYALYTHYSRVIDNKMVTVPVGIEHKYAIVIVVDQHYKTMDGSTGSDWIANGLSFRGYSTSSFISMMLADYIRRLGYPATAHHFFDYQVVLAPLLLLAGIGETCRMGGLVLNPFIGTRFKAAAVTTDLPLMPDKPVDFGLQDFCKKCMRCAEECPAGAITSGDKTIYNGYETWKADTDLCSKFRIANQKGASCSTCIKVCPWNKPQGWTHDIVRWMVQHTPFMNDFIIRMDEVFGYGKQNVDNKWWFDLEDIDGIVQVPRSVNNKENTDS
jgi:reductive dehalogenase